MSGIRIILTKVVIMRHLTSNAVTLMTLWLSHDFEFNFKEDFFKKTENPEKWMSLLKGCQFHSNLRRHFMATREGGKKFGKEERNIKE